MEDHVVVPKSLAPKPGDVTMSGALAAALWVCALLVVWDMALHDVMGRNLTMMVIDGATGAYCVVMAVHAAFVWVRSLNWRLK